MHQSTKGRQISVAICTRDRGLSICATLDSVLTADSAVSEVVVVDQSRSGDTAEAITPYLSDQRLVFIRSKLKGLSNARNLALKYISNECVFMTDDDCVLPAGYAQQALQLFSSYPAAAAIYLRVEAAPYDSALGFIPVFLPTQDRILKSVSQLKQSSGIGAGLLLRCTPSRAIGCFDGYLGPGGIFSSADDVDFTVRLLLAGYEVVESKELSVIHHGFRSQDEFRQLVRRDWFGIGAAYAKPMRSKYRFEFALVLAADLFKRSLFPFLRNVARLRPYGIASFVAFVDGFSAGLRQPIDFSTLSYQDKPSRLSS